jgi:hypothetical protein
VAQQRDQANESHRAGKHVPDHCHKDGESEGASTIGRIGNDYAFRALLDGDRGQDGGHASWVRVRLERHLSVPPMDNSCDAENRRLELREELTVRSEERILIRKTDRVEGEVVM